MLNVGGNVASNFLKSNVAQYQPRMSGFWNTLKVYFTVRRREEGGDGDEGGGRVSKSRSNYVHHSGLRCTMVESSHECVDVPSISAESGVRK